VRDYHQYEMENSYSPLDREISSMKEALNASYVPLLDPEFTILIPYTYLSTPLSTLVQRIWLSVKNFYLQVTVLTTIFVPAAVS